MRRVPVVIVGGGITGQLAQMHIPDAEILDWKEDKPNARMTRNYGANYLWKPLPGVECREFKVVTHVDGQPATEEAVATYKAKIGKAGDLNGWQVQFAPTMAGYEFDTLPPARITWEHRITQIDRAHHTLYFAKGKEPIQYDVLISSIPLFSLLSLAGIPQPPGGLQYKPIFTLITRRPPDAPHPREVMYVNYLSDPHIRPYRLCDRFGERHYESIVPFETLATKRLVPGKIYPHASVPEYLDVLAGYNIYTFGRYGSWAPDELVHETWDRIAEWKESHGL